jgi:hypothetical protein
MTNNTRLWQHDNLWRIQSLRQLPDRHGTLQDTWESWRNENGQVMFFASEALARTYLDGNVKEVEDSSNG